MSNEESDRRMEKKDCDDCTGSIERREQCAYCKDKSNWNPRLPEF